MSRCLPCPTCGHQCHGPTLPCPVCEGQPCHVGAEADVVMTTDLDVAVKEPGSARTTAERSKKDDGVTKAVTADDLGRPGDHTVTRRRRVEKDEVQHQVARAFVAAYNRQRGSSYVLVEEEERGQFEDGVLVSAHDDPKRLPLQLRYLDDDLTESLCKTRKDEGSRTDAERIRAVEEAILEKSGRYPTAVKAGALLVLHLAIPLGELASEALRARSFNQHGFREVWIVPFHSEPFRLQT